MQVLRDCFLENQQKFYRKLYLTTTHQILKFNEPYTNAYIFSTDQENNLSCIDKFSKFITVQSIQSRPIIDIKESLIRIMKFFKENRQRSF